MPGRSILTERQRSVLFDLPTDDASMLLHYTLADDDLEHINCKRCFGDTSLKMLD